MSTTPFDLLLSDPYAARHYLVELAPFDLVAGTVVSLYYSDHGFTTGPAETPAHRHFEARVVEALNFERSIFRPGAIGGPSLPSFGEIRLNNADGGLDFFRNLAFDGREVVVRLGGKGFGYADFGVVFRGTAHSAVVDEQQVAVRLRDLQYKLDAPLQAELYDPPGAGEDALDLAFTMVGIADNSYLYASLSGISAYTFQAGDVLKYDVYWPSRRLVPQKVAIDLSTATSSLRATAAVDQNNLSAHPTTDLSAHASGKWYARSIPIPASLHGSAITHYDVACEYDPAAGTTAIVRAFVRNIRITDGSNTLRKAIWTGGAALGVTPHLSSHAGNQLSVKLRSELESGASLEGRPKSLCFGKCLNVSPVQINPSLLLYQVHDGPIQAIDAVYNRGVALAGGQYTVDLLRGTFTLLQAPGDGGVITADVRGDTLGGSYVSTVAGIARRVVATYGPLTAADLDTASFTALDAAKPAVAGLYASDQRTILDVLDELVNSIGAFYGFDRGGKFEVGLFGPPKEESPAAATFGPAEILEIEALPTELPAWRQRVGYERNWTVQTGDSLAGSVTEARKAFLAEEVRLAVAADETVKTKFLLALDPEPLPTLLADKAAAEVEANHLLGLYGQRREMYRVTVKTQPYRLELGDQIALDYTRFGLDGRLFRVVGLEERADVNRVTMELWG
ncbi:MAG TPA: hypothetical protein VN493_01395 [Thermoanaerobaculia bacterium]|nr:hypothetical protein [Thermoanaerobaculia bacterium]